MRTERLSEIIRSYITEEDITYEQFAKKCGVSKSYISVLLREEDPNTHKPTKPKLETYEMLAKGMGIGRDELIARVEGKKMFTRIISNNVRAHCVPTIRYISDNATLKETIEKTTEMISIVDDLYKDNTTIAYIVGDNKLSPEIIENDIVIVWLDEEVNDGDIVLTINVTNNEIGCYKISIIEDGKDTLIYGNLLISPVIESKSNLKIIGKVISLQRKL